MLHTNSSWWKGLSKRWCLLHLKFCCYSWHRFWMIVLVGRCICLYCDKASDTQCRPECKKSTSMLEPNRGVCSIRDTCTPRPASPHSPETRIWKLSDNDWKHKCNNCKRNNLLQGLYQQKNRTNVCPANLPEKSRSVTQHSFHITGKTIHAIEPEDACRLHKHNEQNGQSWSIHIEEVHQEHSTLNANKSIRIILTENCIVG